MYELEKCLRAGRKGMKLTQPEFARMAGVETKDIINLESGLFAALDNESLGRIASLTGMDETMLRSMYFSEFRQELKELQKQDPPAGNGSGPSGSGQEDMSVLADLGKAIMAIPPETRAGLISTIRMLVRAASLTVM